MGSQDQPRDLRWRALLAAKGFGWRRSLSRDVAQLISKDRWSRHGSPTRTVFTDDGYWMTIPADEHGPEETVFVDRRNRWEGNRRYLRGGSSDPAELAAELAAEAALAALADLSARMQADSDTRSVAAVARQHTATLRPPQTPL